MDQEQRPIIDVDHYLARPEFEQFRDDVRNNFAEVKGDILGLTKEVRHAFAEMRGAFIEKVKPNYPLLSVLVAGFVALGGLCGWAVTSMINNNTDRIQEQRENHMLLILREQDHNKELEQRISTLEGEKSMFMQLYTSNKLVLDTPTTH